MKPLYLARLLVIIVAFAPAGCGPTEITFTKKSSYADLVVTYNAEVETLEKLEAKRKTLIADYFSQAQEKAIRAAVSSIESGDARMIPSNPNQALDRAVAAAEMQAQLQSGLMGGLGSEPDSEEAAANYPEELKRKLTDVDTEISDQKERVQRAKEARDAAQPK